MRLIGLLILLAGLVLVATVSLALYGAGVMAVGVGVLFLARYLQKREINKPGAPRVVPVHPPAKPPASRRRPAQPARRAPAPVPAKAKAKAKAKRAAPARQRDHEPALDKRFEPIFEGEESAALFQDLRGEISAAAKASLTVMRKAGFVIRARADRVTVSRDNHTETLRSNAAIVDYERQLGLSAE